MPWDLELERGISLNSLNRSFLSVFCVAFAVLIRYGPQKEFEGEAIHAFHYTTAKKYAGKKAVVVGAGTSGHDIALDLANHGVGQ